MPKCKIARFNMKLNQIYFINLLNNINDITSFIHQYKAINQPLGSMPLDANSLRIILFIQAETEASPSWETALFIAFSSCGSTLNAICLLPFVLKVVDMGLSPRYSLSSVNQLYCNRHQKATRLRSVVTTNKPLTNNLTKDKTMAMLGTIIALLDVLEQADFNQLKEQTANEAFKGINHLVKEISNIQFDWVIAGVEEVTK